MAMFEIDPSGVRQTAEQFAAFENQLFFRLEEVEALVKEISRNESQLPQARAVARCAAELRERSKEMGRLSKALDQIGGELTRSEQSVTQSASLYGIPIRIRYFDQTFISPAEASSLGLNFEESR